MSCSEVAEKSNTNRPGPIRVCPYEGPAFAECLSYIISSAKKFMSDVTVQVVASFKVAFCH